MNIIHLRTQESKAEMYEIFSTKAMIKSAQSGKVLLTIEKRYCIGDVSFHSWRICK